MVLAILTAINVSKSGSLGNLIQLIVDVNCIVHTIHLEKRAK